MADPEQQGLLSVSGSPVFGTTHWSVVLQAGQSQSPEGRAALERLCRAYWYPLFVFIRRQGQTQEAAKDLTQEFFARLLERNDLQTVHARKGKFRTFLLTSLTHFLSNERDRARAVKRGGGRTILSLDEMSADQLRRFEPSSNLSPDRLFDQRWAMALLEEAVARLRLEMAANGKQSQFEVLKTFLTDEPRDGQYAEVVPLLEMSGGSVAVAVYRMRQRYQELVRAEVAATVSSPTELEEELRHLRAVIAS